MPKKDWATAQQQRQDHGELTNFGNHQFACGGDSSRDSPFFKALPSCGGM